MLEQFHREDMLLEVLAKSKNVRNHYSAHIADHARFSAKFNKMVVKLDCRNAVASIGILESFVEAWVCEHVLKFDGKLASLTELAKLAEFSGIPSSNIEDLTSAVKTIDYKYSETIKLIEQLGSVPNEPVTSLRSISLLQKICDLTEKNSIEEELLMLNVNLPIGLLERHVAEHSAIRLSGAQAQWHSFSEETILAQEVANGINREAQEHMVAFDSVLRKYAELEI